MYLEFYGLKEIPFAISSSLERTSETKNRNEIIKQLLQEINKNGELKVLIGETGSGKTTIIHSILKSISDDFYVIPIFKPIKTTYDLLREICAHLDIQISSLLLDEIIPKVLSRLKFIVGTGKKPLLILDNAHIPSKNIYEIVQNLFRLNKSISNFLRVFLVGEPQIEKKLFETNKKFHLAKNWSKIQLPTLTLQETEAYIKNRLQEMNNKQQMKDIFSEEAINKIFQYSNGNPRKINILCNNSLVLGYLKSVEKIDAEIIEKVKSDEVCLYEIKKLIGNEKKSTEQTRDLHNPNTFFTTKSKNNGLNKSNVKEVSAPLKNYELKKPQKLSHLKVHPKAVATDLNRVIDNILFHTEGRQLKIIGVTNPVPQQGATTISLELSQLLANRYKNDKKDESNGLLLIDTNIQHPLLASTEGLTELLSGEGNDIDNVITNTNLDFSFIAAGNNKSFTINQNHVKKYEFFLHQLKNRFEFIIIDLPPILHDPKSITLANFCDGVIIVVQAGKCKLAVVEDSKRKLEKSGVPILGGILNRRKFFIPDWLYKMV